uniref:Cell growth-regulating nucleolar protein n=1 Tax=Branchiostoma floridae TaxID=7739 RepID=C3Y4B3_BRAFL|eukprot:XP_002609129.1 hypothetical protein BRAFLDRAFT_115317 [Branchiostoma floridae]
MVFFNCNACGQTVKKNQVEKHYLTVCRSCDMLSCLDCGKDFWGDDYKTHTQCISEEDKYGGKGITGHRMTKGEAKQDAWLKQVQKAMNDANASPQVRNLWERLSQYSNIPRKKGKFENFVKNSLRIHNNHLVTQVWEVFSAAQQQQQKEQQQDQEKQKESEQIEKEDILKEHQTKDKSLENDSKEDSGKVSKRQKKEERQLKANKKEKKDRSKENGDTETDTKQKKQKKSKETEENMLENGTLERRKKKKLKSPKNEECQSKQDDVSGPQKSKRKKRKHQDLEEDTCEEKVAEDSNTKNEEEQPKKKKKKLAQPKEEQTVKPAKFPWESVISAVLLKADDHQVSVKKLTKKVLAEFHARGGDGKTRTEEKLLATFHKKVNKNPRFKVIKDRVTLVQ